MGGSGLIKPMKLIAGLGNPGGKYEYTRHNAGFLILNAFVSQKMGDGIVWLEETKFQAHIFRDQELLFVKPQTFMNKVGESIGKLVQFYQIDLNDLLVIHDDVDLKLGDFKLKKNSGSAGHHGVDDIVSQLGGTNDFWRLRIGVGRPEDKRFDVEDYVLQKFSEEELGLLKALFEKELFAVIDKFIS